MALRDRWEWFDLASLELLRPDHALVDRRQEDDLVAQPRRLGPLPDRWSSCCCRGSCSARLMPTCGSRPICSRSRWSPSASRSRRRSRFQRTIAIAALAFVLVAHRRHHVFDVALRRELRPRARRARPCPARRADGELHRPALRRALGDVAAAPSVRRWRSSATTPSPTTSGRWQARNCSTSAIAPGWPFIRDATQIVTPRALPRARSGGRSTRRSPNFPRDAFDYVWLIDAAALRRRAHPGARTGLAQRLQRPL